MKRISGMKPVAWVKRNKPTKRVAGSMRLTRFKPLATLCIFGFLVGLRGLATTAGPATAPPCAENRPALSCEESLPAALACGSAELKASGGIPCLNLNLLRKGGVLASFGLNDRMAPDGRGPALPALASAHEENPTLSLTLRGIFSRGPRER